MAEKEKRVLTSEDKKVIRKLYWRSMMLQGTSNSVTMQGHGVLYTIMPYLDEFYKDDHDELVAAYDRHSQYFNTNPYTGGIVWSLIYILEKKRSQDRSSVSAEAIQNTKIALMGPLAAIGDTLFQGSMNNIVAAMAMGLAQEGNYLSILLYQGLWCAYTFGAKWFFVKYTYTEGDNFISKLLETNLFEKLQDVISVVGLIMVGCLVASTVRFSFNWVVNFGGVEMDIQKQLFDKLLPGILPLGIQLIVFSLLRKRVAPQYLIYGIMAICVVLSLLGVL